MVVKGSYQTKIDLKINCKNFKKNFDLIYLNSKKFNKI